MKNITYDDLEDKFSIFHQISKILNRKSQNKLFCLFFFFFFFTISREKFSSKQFSNGKKLKKMLFFLIFFIPRDLDNNA